MTSTPRPQRYGHLEFNSPMTVSTADALVASLVAAGPERIVDVGCGWAELLLRLLEAAPTAIGRGIDHDEELLRRAAESASSRALSDRVSFDAAVRPDDAGDLVLNVGAEHVFGSVDDALSALRDLVVPGGRLLFGTLIWDRPPSAALLEDFGELPRLDELIEQALTAGWRPLALRTASSDDWDRFELGYLGDWEQVVMTGDAAAAAVVEAREAADAHRRAYLQRRGVLGFAYLTLGRPGSSSAGG